MRNINSIYKNVFDKSQDGLVILKDEFFVQCNEKAKKILQIVGSEYVGQSIYNFSTNKKTINGKEVNIDKILFDDIVKNKVSKLEWEFKTSNGLLLYVEIQITRNIENDTEYTFVVLKDVTARKRFDLMLNARITLLQEASNLTLKSLFQKTLSEIVLLTESEGGFYYIVDTKKRMLILEATEAVNSLVSCELELDIDSNEEIENLIFDLSESENVLIDNNSKKFKYLNCFDSKGQTHKQMLIPVIRNNSLMAIIGIVNKPYCYNRLDAEMAKTMVDLMWDIAEKKKSELALYYSENRFKNVFENTSFGLVICSISGSIKLANKAFCNILKYNLSEIQHLNFFELIHPDYKIDDADLERLINGEIENYTAEILCVNKWGDIKWVNVSINVQLDYNGKAISLISLIEDITEKKQTVFKLAKSEERFKLLSKMASEGICIHDKGVIIDANDALADMLGAENVEELIGVNFLESDLIPSESKAKLNEIILTKKEAVYDIVARRKNGEEFYMELIGRNLFYDGRNYRIGAIRDITERKKSEQRLQNSEKNFREFFDNTIISLFVFNRNGQILKANNHACELLGYSLEELQKMKITDLHPLSEKKSSEKNFINVIEGTCNSCVLPFVSKLDVHIPMTTYISGGTWNEEQAFFCVGKDMSELKKSEEKFNKAFHKNGNAMIIATRSDIRFIDANQKALEITGYNRSELIGKTDLELKLYFDELMRNKLLASVSKKDVSEYLYQFYNKKGELLTINLNASSIEILDDDYFLISFSDVTDKIKTENALIESETRLKEITENVQEGIILANMNYKYVFVNDTFSKMTGFSKKELLKMTIDQLVVNPSDFQLANKLVHSGGSILKRYVAMKRKDKSVFYINVSARKISIGGENYILGTQQDVTLEYESEQKLLKAYKEITSLKNKIEQENIMLREEISKTHSFNEIITRNSEFKKTLQQIEVVAPTDASVLIAGETGTGKELIARAIHTKSKRSGKTMVKMNCAAIPEALIESELFGHEKGAFTGAIQQKIGRFEIANGGTLFLDEIGEMPIDLQSKLLRVLQEGEFERVGGSKTIKVDVRIITATNKDLENEIDNGNFRLDLFYRLNVFPVTIPPLRDRIDDISLLTNHFVERFNVKLDKNITQIPVRVMNELIKYRWPGNIRELENLIERAMILSRGNTLQIDFLTNKKGSENQHTKFVSFEEMQKKYIENVLNHTNWKISGKNGATEILDLKYSTLASKMQKLGIKKIK